MANSPSFGNGPLSDLRVIELGTLLAGPFCGQLLGDMGAEVIKVEPPGQGDPMRVWGREKAHGKSLWWPVVARNKKAITLDLREAEGQAILKELVAEVGLSARELPSGHDGKMGPGLGGSVRHQSAADHDSRLRLRADRPLRDAGRFRRHRRGDGWAALRRRRSQHAAVAAWASASATRSRPRSPASARCPRCITAKSPARGQVVDSAIYEAVLNMMESLVTEYDKAGYMRERTGAILPNVAPSNVYPTRDGQMVLIAANQDTVFGRLAEAMGQPELARDARYATHTARGANQVELDALVSAWTSTLSRDEVLQAMEKHGVPSGLIYRAPEMLQDPHFEARQAIVSVAHPDFGQLKMQNVAPKLSATPGGVRAPSPHLGQHNEEIYRGLLGMSTERYDALRTSKVI